jgi:hypothetical protein
LPKDAEPNCSVSRCHLNANSTPPTPEPNPYPPPALENLVVFGALTVHSEPTGGRPSTLWSASEEDEHEENEESVGKTKNRQTRNSAVLTLIALFALLFLKPLLLPVEYDNS